MNTTYELKQSEALDSRLFLSAFHEFQRDVIGQTDIHTLCNPSHGPPSDPFDGCPICADVPPSSADDAVTYEYAPQVALDGNVKLNRLRKCASRLVGTPSTIGLAYGRADEDVAQLHEDGKLKNGLAGCIEVDIPGGMELHTPGDVAVISGLDDDAAPHEDDDGPVRIVWMDLCSVLRQVPLACRINACIEVAVTRGCTGMHGGAVLLQAVQPSIWAVRRVRPMWRSLHAHGAASGWLCRHANA